MAGGDAAEVLQRVERALDAPAQPVDTAIGVTGLVLVQVFAQLGAIVVFVAEHPLRRFHMRRPVGLDCRVDLRGIRCSHYQSTKGGHGAIPTSSVLAVG